jgi:hypothetical protein
MSRLQADYNTPFEHSGLKDELHHVHIEQPEDLAFRKLAGKGELDIIFSSLANTPNSDYFPILDIGAAKARFKKTSAISLYMFYTSKVLKRLVNDTSQPPDEVTEGPFVQAGHQLNEKRQFHRLFNNYSESGGVPIFIASATEAAAKNMAEIIFYCTTTQDRAMSEDVSKQVMDLAELAYDYSTREELRQLFERLDGCRRMLSENGIMWLDAHWAWLDGDLVKVQKLTEKYLDNQQLISTLADKHLLIINLASSILNGTEADIEQYQGKVSKEIANDLELRGVFNLIDTTRIQKE